MKSLTDRIRSVFKSKKGEALVESVLSMLLFAILVPAITGMITTSFNMISNATIDTTAMQNGANTVIVGGTVTGSGQEITFTNTTSSISVREELVTLQQGGFISFGVTTP